LTTQAVVAKIGGSQGSRSYLVTATDGTWNNQLVTQTGGAQLGFAQTGRVINAVQVQYTAGSGVWRIKNRVTQQTKAFGFLGKANATSNDVNTVEGGKIPPIQIMQDDILEVYVAAVA
jgi:hypothetical protein